MRDSFPFKIYTSEGMIISECSTMIEAIARAVKLNCSWAKLPNQQVGQIVQS